MNLVRKFFSLVLLFLFSFSLFAGPGGGGGGDGGGHDSGGHDGGGHDGGSNGPSGDFGGHDGGGHGDFADHGDVHGHDHDDGGFGPSFSHSERGPGNFGREQDNSGDSDSRMPEYEPHEIMNYRGSRMLADSGAFTVQTIKTERKSSSSLSFEVTFNQSVNPRSVTSSSILINGKEAPKKTKFHFNKKGDTVRVELPLSEDDFVVTIQNIVSYDGTPIEPLIIDGGKK